MMFGTVNAADALPGAFANTLARALEIAPSVGDREAINHLLELAEENLKTARHLRSIAVELLGRSRKEPDGAKAPDVDAAYNSLDLRFRRSARLLTELLATPDLPRKDEELAILVCLRKPSVPALRVYVHDLRSALTRAGLDGVVKCHRRKGYFVAREDIGKIMKRIG